MINMLIYNYYYVTTHRKLGLKIIVVPTSLLLSDIIPDIIPARSAEIVPTEIGGEQINKRING